MNEDAIEFSKESRVAVIAFNRDAVERLDPLQTASRFADICSEISSDSQMQVVVITGVGDNLFESKESESCTGRDSFGRHVPSIVENAASLEIPVLIGLHGYIAGQALELALACDIRIATSQSQFAMPQASMGFIPFAGGTQRRDGQYLGQPAVKQT